MKQRLAILCATWSTLYVLVGASTVACAEDPVEWNGIARLNIDLTAQETGPFLQLAPVIFDPARKDKVEKSTTSPVHTPKVQLASHEQVSELALLPEHNGPGEKSRSQLRESLAQSGEESLASRDQLTSELVGMMRWTVATIVIATVTLIGLKKFRSLSQTSTPQNRIRVLETLDLGRQQGLKLVEVGGERFLVASDQTGIKSVTLLPSWPDLEQDEDRPQRAATHVEPRLFAEEFADKLAG